MFWDLRMLYRSNQRFKLLRELNYYVNLHSKGNCSLEFMVFKEECLVRVCHYLTLNKLIPSLFKAYLEMLYRILCDKNYYHCYYLNLEVFNTVTYNNLFNLSILIFGGHCNHLV